MVNVKRKYIIRAYYADPHKKEYYKEMLRRQLEG